MTHYVYILRCADGSYYVGSASDVAERLEVHNAGRGATYTAKRRPITLVYAEEHPDELAAMRRERQLKGWSHLKRDALVTGDIARLKQLSRRRECVVRHSSPCDGGWQAANQSSGDK